MRWISIALTVVLLAIVVADGGGPQAAPMAKDPVWVASSLPMTAEELAQAPARIDALVDACLVKAGLTANPPLADAAFLRRASLDLLGRLPTGKETAAYLADQSASRHRLLIERTIANPAHAQARFLFLADLLRVQSQVQNRYPGQSYIAWLQKAAIENRPWDVLTRSLITASGAAFARNNGASGFWLRDAGMPIDRVAHEAQAFLGTRVGCAQCHDHPYDTWTRKQYYQVAAFTADTKVDRRPPNPGQSGPVMKKLGEDLDPQDRNILRQLSLISGTQVLSGRAGTIPLPQDWKDDDGKPGEKVPAAPLWGEASPGKDPRISWAGWMTSPENPRFAAVMAHRIWARLMGYPIAPVDSWTDAVVPADPELMEFLTRVLVSSGFDLNRFETILAQTRAYRRAPVNEDAGPPGHRAGPVLRRLSAEQIWDSLVTLAVANPDDGFGAEPTSLWDRQEQYATMDSTSLRAEVERLAAARQRSKAVEAELAAAKQIKDFIKVKALRAERDRLASESETLRGRRPGAGGDAMLRAAVLPQPAPPGHPLRILGQSDRELIDNGSTQPSVAQALLLLNGVVEKEIANRPASAVLALAAAAPTVDARIDRLWTTILGRPPTAEERARARAHLTDGKPSALGDVAWALICSTEFLFRP